MKFAWIANRRRLVILVGVLVLLVGLAGEVRPYVRRAWSTPTNAPVLVALDNPYIGSGNISFSYTVTNRTSDAILVLDQMMESRSMDAENTYGTPDDAWGYVDLELNGWSFHGRTYKAIVSRRIQSSGTFVCDRPMPYGRRLEAGKSLSGHFLLALPLKEDNAVGERDHPRVEGSPFDQMVDVREIELQIGWSAELPPDPSPDRRKMTTFSYKDQTLWYFTPGRYYWLEPIQQVASSRGQLVHAKGLLY